MLEMYMMLFLVFGGFGVLAIAYIIANVVIGMGLAFVHSYNGGKYPKEIFLDWMKHI